MRLLLRYPAFARFWLAEALSLTGDWFSLVAISILAVQEGGGEGAWAVAVTLALHELPMALMRPVAGVLADRFDRRSLLVGVHLGQAALTLLMVQRAMVADVPALQALVLLRSVLTGLDGPARSGALRRLVPADELLAAHALTGATWSATYAFGMALGGLVSSLGVPLALALDSFSFVVAALLLGTLPALPTRRPEVGWAGAWGRARRDLAEAGRLAWADRALLRAVCSKTPVGLAGGAGVVLLNVLADRLAFAGTAAASLGLLQAARGIGTGLGPGLAAHLITSGRPLVPIWQGTAWVAFLGIAAVAVLPGGWVLLAATLFWGMGTGANWMISSAEIQRRAPDEAIGRLSGLDLLLVEGAFAASALVGGAAIEWSGQPSSAALAGLSLGILAWLGLQAAVRARLGRIGG